MFSNFCVGIHRYSALTYDVIKSYLTRVRDKKICNGYITIGKKGCYVIKICLQTTLACRLLYMIQSWLLLTFSQIKKKKRKLGEEMACEIQPVKIRIPDHIKEITETCSSRSKHVKCEYA